MLPWAQEVCGFFGIPAQLLCECDVMSGFVELFLEFCYLLHMVPTLYVVMGLVPP